MQAPTPDAVRVSVLQLMKERSVPRLAASSRSALLQLKVIWTCSATYQLNWSIERLNLLDTLQVTDLRAELQKWGLSSEGRKEVLADKLLQELLPARQMPFNLFPSVSPIFSVVFCCAPIDCDCTKI